MNLSIKIFSKDTLGLDVLRLAVCGILFTHGAYRIYLGEVSGPDGFEGVLRDQHVPLSWLGAWMISLTESVGSVLMALRLVVLPICGILSMVLFMGILFFNRHHGFSSSARAKRAGSTMPC